jgi:hypothetical protein
MMLLLAILASAATPEEVELGTRLARSGNVASIIPVIEMRQTEELIKAMPHLTKAERDRFRATAHAVAEKGTDFLFRAEGRAYAERLSLADLKALIAFEESEVAKRKRAVEPAVTVATMEAMRGFNFKQEVMKAFCAENKKLCPKDAAAGR